MRQGARSCKMAANHAMHRSRSLDSRSLGQAAAVIANVRQERPERTEKDGSMKLFDFLTRLFFAKLSRSEHVVFASGIALGIACLAYVGLKKRIVPGALSGQESNNLCTLALYCFVYVGVFVPAIMKCMRTARELHRQSDC